MQRGRPGPGVGCRWQDSLRQENLNLSIVRCQATMRRIFWNPIAAFLAAICVRLFFLLKFPASSGDAVVYEQIAINWLQHHVFAMNIGDSIVPVDLRMPGYPAFLAIVYAITRRTGPAARFYVDITQMLVDVATCAIIGAFAA